LRNSRLFTFFSSTRPLSFPLPPVPLFAIHGPSLLPFLPPSRITLLFFLGERGSTSFFYREIDRFFFFSLLKQARLYVSPFFPRLKSKSLPSSFSPQLPQRRGRFPSSFFFLFTRKASTFFRKIPPFFSPPITKEFPPLLFPQPEKKEQVPLSSPDRRGVRSLSVPGVVREIERSVPFLPRSQVHASLSSPLVNGIYPFSFLSLPEDLVSKEINSA